MSVVVTLIILLLLILLLLSVCTLESTADDDDDDGGHHPADRRPPSSFGNDLLESSSIDPLHARHPRPPRRSLLLAHHTPFPPLRSRPRIRSVRAKASLPRPSRRCQIPIPIGGRPRPNYQAARSRIANGAGARVIAVRRGYFPRDRCPRYASMSRFRHARRGGGAGGRGRGGTRVGEGTEGVLLRAGFYGLWRQSGGGAREEDRQGHGYGR
mmetsp:Transcript_29174/g.70391  ORF Transcript_29174/g.70391 Transcript_29174/m.70391 type:complete len:212 (+) Transcript_29174:1161-1796(+)